MERMLLHEGRMLKLFGAIGSYWMHSGRQMKDYGLS